MMLNFNSSIMNIHLFAHRHSFVIFNSRKMDQSRESWQDTKSFYLKIFSAIDEDVNGYLSDKEFKKFLISCDIQVNLVFQFAPEKLGHFESKGWSFLVFKTCYFFQFGPEPSSSDFPWSMLQYSICFPDESRIVQRHL